MDVLLVEPSYRSKFPPLGLMRLSTYHKGRGDHVAFVRGKDSPARGRQWDRVYVASLFTWELPRTVDTIKYYLRGVAAPGELFVGGPGVTLLPDYVKDRVQCTVVEGPLDVPGHLGPGTPAVADLVPDYSILSQVEHDYFPKDSFFVRVTKGCPRSCKFCAVPLLEKEFGPMSPLRDQVGAAREQHGEKQHLVVMDNNILAIPGFDRVVAEIRALGFERGAKRNRRQRTVDFNQGLDARLIAAKPQLARALATICTSPVRLAFDYPGVRAAYEKAVRLLAAQGFQEFTNYMLFNFNDTPRDLYDRLLVNARLNQELGIRITGFPMRFIPMDDVSRKHVAPAWKWRYLRGIQCVLLATHGLVSPNPDFIRGAFGETFDDFLEILSMPDRYIIYRKHYANDGAEDWKRLFRKLSAEQKAALPSLLQELNADPRGRSNRLARLDPLLSALADHYYPHGETAPRTPVRPEWEVVNNEAESSWRPPGVQLAC